jgi:hypothetical protein
MTQWFTACALAAKGNAVFEDVNGYAPLPDYPAFHGKLSSEDIQGCFYRNRPLGMTVEQFDDFKRSLRQALLDDGLEPHTCDIRLKGSSSGFYSGWHKLMPYHREVLRDAFNSSHKQRATETDLDSIEAEIKKGWPNEFLRPIRRPFDSMTLIGVSPNLRGYLSDYDVQVSSAKIEELVTKKAHELKMPVILKEEYGFFNEEIVDEVCHQLVTQWPASQRKALGRNVNVKTFSDKGPPDQTANIGYLSSHLDDAKDWRLIV